MAEKRKDKDGRILPENVTQRKDGTYMWRKSVNGKNYCLYAKTLGEIKQKRNVALGEIEKGEFKGKHEKMREERELAKRDITLNEWFFRWEKSYRICNVRENTLQINHQQYMHYFSDTIGKMKVNSIKQIHIVNSLNELHKGGLKQSSLVKGNSLLILIFDAAVKNGIAEDNPARGALKIPKERPKEKRVLTENEEEKFLEYISNNGFYKRYVPFFIVGFGTGMRLGEILALTWNDINFEKSTIHIDKTLVRVQDHVNNGGMKIFINEPKTYTSIRDIPMLPKVKEALQYQREHQIKCKVSISGYTDFVFVSKTGNVFSAANIFQTIKNIVARINKENKEKAGSEDYVYFETFSPHCMRHTFTTRCYEKGVHEKVIQKILGHSKLDMTLNVYTHTTDEMIEEDMRKLED